MQIVNDAAESILESVVSSSLTITNLTESEDAGVYLCRLSETETTEQSETSVDLTILGNL